MTTWPRGLVRPSALGPFGFSAQASAEPHSLACFETQALPSEVLRPRAPSSSEIAPGDFIAVRISASNGGYDRAVLSSIEQIEGQTMCDIPHVLSPTSPPAPPQAVACASGALWRAKTGGR